MAHMQGANRLAQPHMHPVACSINPGLQSGFRGLADGSAATLDQLLDLHDSFLDRIPAALQGGAKASDIPGKKRKGGTHMDSTIAGRKGCHPAAPLLHMGLAEWPILTSTLTSVPLRSRVSSVSMSTAAASCAPRLAKGPDSLLQCSDVQVSSGRGWMRHTSDSPPTGTAP